MVLSDRDIRKALQEKRIVVDPLDDSAIQPASVDLRLGGELRVFRDYKDLVIDPTREMPDLTEPVAIDEINPFVLHPGEFALGVTLEEVRLPSDIVGRLDGKSSLGRLGLVVHSTAGFVDPGWRGRLTLELSNLANLPINLSLGMRVSQISFMTLTSPAERPYGAKGLGSKYQGQMVPTPSHFYENYGRAAAPPTERRRRQGPAALGPWLHASDFAGSISRFAEALGVKQKTVEDWVYGRSRPSRRHWPRLYEVTGLPHFKPLSPAER